MADFVACFNDFEPAPWVLVVGLDVGAFVGVAVVGLGVDGLIVWLEEVGREVGREVGGEVGSVVGKEVGKEVGREVGREVGTFVG